MKNIGTSLRVFSLLVLVFFVSLSDARSQDVFREVDQLKKDISQLRNEVENLRSLVYEMRSVVLERVVAPGAQKTEKAPAAQQETAKKEEPVDEAQLTKIICKTVGVYFVEAEAALRMSDPDAADAAMRAAVQKMDAALKGYSATHRVNKLMNIYEDLAWDTYEAVQQRGSIAGNAGFLEFFRKHKQKYNDTCRGK
jgi:hypothetical protein